MEKFDLFKELAERTGGEVYVGVVGPVRTGKSTFIKRVMELLVLPNIADAYDLGRARDALPQAGTGRSVMTTEPKFVPDDGVTVTLADNISLRVRFVDCVGFPFPGALGFEDEEGPRLVNTPWFDEPIPFEQAAELGTRKVIAEHSTIGVVVVTDGSITELPRDAYVGAEERVLAELKALEKPYVVVLNSTRPGAGETQELARSLRERHNVPVVVANAAALSRAEVDAIFQEVLYEFPVKEVRVDLPDWVQALERGHWLRKHFEELVRDVVAGVRRVRDVHGAVQRLAAAGSGSAGYPAAGADLAQMDLGTGTAAIAVHASDELYWRVLEEIAGVPLEGKGDLLGLVRSLAGAKREYDVVAGALREVREVGYGVVPPRLEEIDFEEPEVVRRGSQFGVKLRASAPSLHFIRADVETEVTPFIGTEKQGEEMVNYLLREFEEDPKKIWSAEFFGKSLHDLIREGLQSKLFRMPENAQEKLQETIQRIVNEGSGGLICIII